MVNPSSGTGCYPESTSRTERMNYPNIFTNSLPSGADIQPARHALAPFVPAVPWRLSGGCAWPWLRLPPRAVWAAVVPPPADGRPRRRATRGRWPAPAHPRHRPARRGVQPEDPGDHFGHRRLVRPPVAGHRGFDLGGGVQRNRDTAAGGCGNDDAGGLRHAHHGADVESGRRRVPRPVRRGRCRSSQCRWSRRSPAGARPAACPAWCPTTPTATRVAGGSAHVHHAQAAPGQAGVHAQYTQRCRRSASQSSRVRRGLPG